MERGNKKVLKELSLPLGPVPLGKEQRRVESKCTAKAEGTTRSTNSWSLNKGHTTD